MANVGFKISNSAPITCAAGVETPILLIKAADNHRAIVTFMDITFSGTSPTAAPPVIKIRLATDSGTGGTAVTPVKMYAGDPETLEVTAFEQDWSGAEPTLSTVHHISHAHPQGGRVWNHYLTQPIPLLGNGTNSRMVVTVTAAAEVTALVNAEGAE